MRSRVIFKFYFISSVMLSFFSFAALAADKIYPFSSQVCTDNSFRAGAKVVACEHADGGKAHLFFESDEDMAEYDVKIEAAKAAARAAGQQPTLDSGEEFAEGKNTVLAKPEDRPVAEEAPPVISNANYDADRKAADQAKSEINALGEKYDQVCAPALKTAQRCCQHPEQCLGEEVGADGSQNSLILGALQTILAGAGQAANLSGACGQMQKVALTVTAINAALATKCTAKIYKCKEACKDVIAEAKKRYQDCTRNSASCVGYPAPTLQSAGSQANLQAADNVYRQNLVDARASLNAMANSPTTCSANENYAQRQVDQTIGSALAAKTLGLCKKQSTTEPTTPTVGTNAFNIDCASPANASNPACQNMCNRAGAQNDPACSGALGGLNFGDGRGSALVNPESKLNSAGLDEFELGQDALAQGAAAAGSKISTSSPGGAANLPGGGGGGGGAGTFGGAPAGDGGGYNASSIGNSIRSGSGYINPQGRGLASVGGGSAAQPGSGKPGTKVFNPKDYLPGGPLDPKRKLAGLASTTPEIGAVHGDIFRSITNRFYQICLRDGLYDCATLRKSGTQGN